MVAGGDTNELVDRDEEVRDLTITEKTTKEVFAHVVELPERMEGMSSSFTSTRESFESRT